LDVGRIKIEDTTGQIIEYSTGGGTVEVNDNKVLVLADSVESKEEIDIERAKSAYARAKEKISCRYKKLI